MPIFKLTLQHPQTQNIRHMTYDTDVNSMVWDDGTALQIPDIDALNHMRCHRTDESIMVDPDHPGLKSHEPNRVRIQLGLACNMRCTYCFQKNQHHAPVSSEMDDVETYLEKLPNWCLTPKDKPLKFEFWGGEPLLYLTKIKSLVTGIKKIFPDHEKLAFSVVTNGHRFTQEVAEYFSENGFGMAISHDGPAQYIRGKDPLDNPKVLSAVKWFLDKHGFDRFGFNTVLHSKNQSLMAVHHFLADKLGLSHTDFINISTEEILTVVHEDARDLLPVGDDVGAMISNLAMEMVQQPIVSIPATRKVFQFISDLKYGVAIDTIQQSCGHDRPESISTDLYGRVTPCNNLLPDMENCIGTVDEFENIRLDNVHHWKSRGVCRDCPILHLCKGACMLNTGKEFDDTCKGKLIFNLAAMAAALFICTEHLLVSITADHPMHMFGTPD